jgi:rubredoxin
MSLFTCPCCGFKTLPESPPDSHGICPLCGWQDDSDGCVYAADATGPNKLSLIESQANFLGGKLNPKGGGTFCREEFSYERDPQWRPIDLTVDGFERVDSTLGHIGVGEAVRPWGDAFERPYYWAR